MSPFEWSWRIYCCILANTLFVKMMLGSKFWSNWCIYKDQMVHVFTRGTASCIQWDCTGCEWVGNLLCHDFSSSQEEQISFLWAWTLLNLTFPLPFSCLQLPTPSGERDGSPWQLLTEDRGWLEAMQEGKMLH